MAQKSNIAIVAAILAAGVLIAGAILLSGTGAWKKVLPDPHEEVKAIIRAKLSDPGSAIFQNIEKTKDGDFCGEVNAKNQFGGYTGFKKFWVYHSGGGKWELMEIATIIDKECKK